MHELQFYLSYLTRQSKLLKHLEPCKQIVGGGRGISNLHTLCSGREALCILRALSARLRDCRFRKLVLVSTIEPF